MGHSKVLMCPYVCLNVKSFTVLVVVYGILRLVAPKHQMVVNVHSSFQRLHQNKRFISTRVQEFCISFFSHNFPLIRFLNDMHGSASNASFRLFMLACFRTGDHHLLLVISKLISFSSSCFVAPAFTFAISFHFSLSFSLVVSNACTNYLSFCKIRATRPMR